MKRHFITTALIFGVLAVLAMGVGCGKQVMDAANQSGGQDSIPAETRWLKGVIGLGVEFDSKFGYMLGKNIDRFDADQIVTALDSAPAGATITWKNETSGLKYELWLSSAYQSNGKDGRDIALTALNAHSVNGKLVSRAHKSSNGEWVLNGDYPDYSVSYDMNSRGR